MAGSQNNWNCFVSSAGVDLGTGGITLSCLLSSGTVPPLSKTYTVANLGAAITQITADLNSLKATYAAQIALTTSGCTPGNIYITIS